MFPFRLRILPRTLLFKRPAGTSRGIYRERRVWYIVATSDQPGVTFTGLGECAPLHDLSCDFSADYEAHLYRICKEVETEQRLEKERYRDYPSILFGLETALLSAEASLRGDYRKLFDSPLVRCEQQLYINGLVWMGSFDEMLERMEEKLTEGFRCVKLKIGAIDFEHELTLIRKLRKRFSPKEVELRVDANGGFTPDEAADCLKQLARFSIHSIEQPIRQGQWEHLAQLCTRPPLPIALDEELIGVNQIEEKRALLDTIRPQYIILKPSLHGGLCGAEEWMAEAQKRNIGFWVTSALESNVGLNAIAQWTSHLSERYSQLGEMPQGLGTGQLFVKNYEATPLRFTGDRLVWGDEKQKRFEADLKAFAKEWYSEVPTITVKTSGSTGKPQELVVEKERMRASAKASAKALGLKAGDTALLAMPLQYIAGKMMVVRAYEVGMRIIAVAPSLHPFSTLHEAPRFAALTPMQVYESLKIPHEASLLRRTHCLIIGGGAVSNEVEASLRRFPNAVWSTYGMTETLSHIALRRINGNKASDSYSPLPGVELSLDDQHRLCIFAPKVCAERLVTNDLADLLPNGNFRILGRLDNVICSGGIKLQLEEIEQRLSSIVKYPFMLTAVPDPSLGEALTMLYVANCNQDEALESVCRECLSRHEVPRHYIRVEVLPMTDTGKPARAIAKRTACTQL